MLERHKEIYRFVRRMIAFRKAHPVLRRAEFYTGDDIRWFSPEGDSPDWDDPANKRFSCLILEEERESGLLLMFNASTAEITFELPEPPNGGRWHLAIDTSVAAPEDLCEPGEGRELDDQSAYELGSRSSAILVACSRE